MLDVGGGVRCWGTAAHLKPGCRQGKHLAADPHIVLLLSGYCVFLRFFVWDARHGLRTTRGWGESPPNGWGQPRFDLLVSHKLAELLSTVN